MSKIVSALHSFLQDEEGQDIIEYGLLAAFIAVVAAVLIIQFRDPIQSIYQSILTQLQAAAPPAAGGG